MLEERLSCPESDSDSDSELEELELLELLEESELESEAWPELYEKGGKVLGKIIHGLTLVLTGLYQKIHFLLVKTESLLNDWI